MTQMLNHFFSYDLSQYCKLCHIWLIVREKFFFESERFFLLLTQSKVQSKKSRKKEENPLAVTEIFCNFAFRITNALFMAKKRSIDEYMIRTLSYYQSQGGIYSEIITLLMQLREKKGYRNLIPLPAKVLNAASYYYDEMKDGIYVIPDSKSRILIASVVVIIAAADNNEDIRQKMMDLVENDKTYFTHFAKLLKKQNDDIVYSIRR